MNNERNKKSLINYLGLLGVVDLLAYTAAVIFAPLAYPGYNWMAQAVSDLSASNAPSRIFWDQLSAPCCSRLVCSTILCIYIKDKLTKPLRIGIYLFAIMNWISSVGYGMFPLSESGYAGSFQDLMHLVATAFVVLLSIISLIIIMIGGVKIKKYRYLAIGAAIAFALMFTGPLGMAASPVAYKGIFERFSVFATVGYGAFLGICMFRGIEE